MSRHKCPRCNRRTLTSDGTICNTYGCNWYAGNTADDFLLWRLECMTDPVLRWTMGAFLQWAPPVRAYDWEHDGL